MLRAVSEHFPEYVRLIGRQLPPSAGDGRDDSGSPSKNFDTRQGSVVKTFEKHAETDRLLLILSMWTSYLDHSPIRTFFVFGEF